MSSYCIHQEIVSGPLHVLFSEPWCNLDDNYCVGDGCPYRCSYEDCEDDRADYEYYR